MRHIAFLVGLSLFASTGRVVTFDQVAAGALPPGWSFSTSARRWEVLRDQSAPTPPHVLANIPQAASDRTHPLAILDGTVVRDADISVRIKPVAGRGEEAGGLVWRLLDQNNYYFVRADATAHTVTAYRIQNGRWIQISPTVKHDIPANDWSILKVSARGNRYQVYMDHRRVLDTRDSTFLRPGRVGLSAVADSLTYFDDFRVNPR